MSHIALINIYRQKQNDLMLALHLTFFVVLLILLLKTNGFEKSTVASVTHSYLDACSFDHPKYSHMFFTYG